MDATKTIKVEDGDTGGLQKIFDQLTPNETWPEWKCTLQRAVDNWGASTQADKAIEEMGELMQAIMKYRHKGPSEGRLDNLLEEIADVEILLDQLKMIHDLKGQIPAIKVRKLNRLKQILDDGGFY